MESYYTSTGNRSRQRLVRLGLARPNDNNVRRYNPNQSHWVRLPVLIMSSSLHSHEVKYPRGSGYQSVTGMVYDNDYNSLWTIREPHHETVKTYSIHKLIQTNRCAVEIPFGWNMFSPEGICTPRTCFSP